MDPKTYLVLLHLIGLVVGLGSVTTLDIYLLKFLKGDTVTRSDAGLVELVSKLALVGLVFLWISGLGFLVLAWMNTPELLGNPKLHAKMLVVAVLTINGGLLHFKVLPQVRRAIGRPLFCKSGERSDRVWMRVCGAVSAASWWTPFVLGTVRELNYAAPIWVFLTAYVVLLGLIGAGFTVLEHWLSHRGKQARAQGVAAEADAAPTDLPGHALHADRPERRTVPKKEEAHRVPHEEKTFGSDGGDDFRPARDRVRDYYIRPDDGRPPASDGRADRAARDPADERSGTPRH